MRGCGCGCASRGFSEEIVFSDAARSGAHGTGYGRVLLLEVEELLELKGFYECASRSMHVGASMTE